ncbi:MAG: phosphotransferase [Anaerolineae bacterium]|nr:phosphotransferase [Anaerolineae bacterium]
MIPVPAPIQADLAQQFGVEPDALRHFGGGDASSDGIVCAYPHEQGRRLLKIMAIPLDNPRRGRLALEERLRFMHYLGEHGATVAYPQLSPKGHLYETAAGTAHLWVAYRMDPAPGEAISEHAWDPTFFHRWGQVIGRLHRLARDYPSWRAAVDPDTGESFLTWENEWQRFYEWCPDNDVKEQWLALKVELDLLPVERASFGFIHNDPHIWNLRADGDRITILDFDVANHHWFMTDIAIACQNILIFHSGGLNGPIRDREKLLAFLDAFLQGYEREHSLATTWLNRLDLFIAYRRILLYIAMQDWVSSQPDLARTWKRLIVDRPCVAGKVRG